MTAVRFLLASCDSAGAVGTITPAVDNRRTSGATTMGDPYSRFQPDQLTLRDELAVDRTVLANERTLLGYVRTSLGFLVLGLSFLHFLHQAYYHVAGYGFMAVAAIVLVVGSYRFLHMRQRLAQTRRKPMQHKVSEE